MAIVRGGITVKPHVQAFVNACEAATGAKDYGTYVGHAEGETPPAGPTQAVDIFNPDTDTGHALQNVICAFVLANVKRFGIRYVVRREYIWNIERADEGWRWQGHQGNRTKDHYDHVHVTFYATAPEVGPIPTPTPTPTQEALPMQFTYIYNKEDYVYLGTEGFHGRLPFNTLLAGLKKSKLVHDFGTVDTEFHTGVKSLADQLGFIGDV